LAIKDLTLEDRLDIPINKFWDEFDDEFNKLKIQRLPKLKGRENVKKNDKKGKKNPTFKF
jgi:hypothetical protein